MKNNYKTIKKAAIGLLSLITIEASAQALSGAYTIVNGGTPSATTFTSFASFAGAVNTNGIGGPITVNVTPGSGPYNEQVMFNQAPGTSGVNNITINGNGNTLTFNSTTSSQPWTLLLSGSDYMTINNLNVTATGPTYAMAVVLTGAANYNTFNNSQFSCPVNGTSTYMCPFSISSSNTSPTSSGSDAGNFNTINTCTMTNGYYGITMYGLTGSPYQQGNSLLNSLITDYYTYGAYFPYGKGHTLRGNTFQRPTRTSAGTVYGCYCYYQQGSTIESNKFWKMYESQLNASSSFYAFYMYGNPISNNPLRNTVRNNVITAIKNNSTVYGIYGYNSNSDVYNNTFDLDNPNATAGTVYGMYIYASSGYSNTIQNNILSVARGSSTGTKYGIYFAGVTGNVTSDRNVIYMSGSTGGTNYYGYYSSAATSFTAYQQQGVDATSFSVSPSFSNQAQFDVHPTNAAINNTAIPMGLVFDQQGAIRNQTTPDVGALEFLTPNCAGTPSLVSVISPTYAICPGQSANLILNYLQTDAGIGFQWQYSTVSPVGPWTNVTGANGPLFTTPSTTSNIYYSAAISCANGGGSVQAISGAIVVAGTTTNNVPYHENFEGVAYPGQLPNCSWALSTSTSVAQTYTLTANNFRQPHTGSKFMSFNGTAGGTNYAYTSGIQLYAGVTYSTGLWYLTEYSGLSNFSDLSILLGTAQATTGLNSIVSTGGAAVATQYKLLSSTFTVATSGIYYLAVRATNSACNYYLSVDDIFVTMPCNAANNTPTVSVSGPSSICLGTPVSLLASGANSYNWTLSNSTFTSANAGISNTPSQSGLATFIVSGTNSITSCSGSTTKTVNVIAGPLVSAYVTNGNNAVCPNVVTVLHAVGTALSYTWDANNGAAAQNATVMPSANTVYTVTGSNSTNCTTSATIALTVKNLPVVSGSPSRSVICAGEKVTLNGTGADTYTWTSNSALLVGNPMQASPSAPTNYTLIATDNSTGCNNTAIVSVIVSACTGINTIAASNAGVQVYPNPNNGEFIVSVGGNTVKTISVIDLTGRMLLSNTTTDESVNFNINNLSNGVYFVKVQANDKTEVIKVVKH